MSSSAIVFGQTDVSLQGAVGFKNKVINGNFDIWQRGTSANNVVDRQFVADRFFTGVAGSSCNVSRESFTIGQSEVPNNPTFFHRSTVTSSAGTNNNCVLHHGIEDVRTLAGEIITLSFWAKADANKNIAVEINHNYGSGGSVGRTISVTTCALTTSWKKFTITTTIPSLNTTPATVIGTGSMLRFLFWFDAGSGFNNRTNSLGQQSGVFDIAQVQLEKGSIATPFEMRPIGAELSLCQRYYQQVSNLIYRFANYSASTTTVHMNIFFKTTMRSSPTVSVTYDIQDGPDQTVNAPNAYPDGFYIGVSANTLQYIDISSYRASAEL